MADRLAVPNVQFWISPDTELSNLLGVGDGVVFAARCSKKKIRSLVADLSSGISPVQLLKESGELTLLRQVTEVRTIDGKKVDDSFCGPFISIRRQGKPAIEMVLPGGVEQGNNIVCALQEQLGPSFKRVTVPSMSVWTALVGPFVLACSLGGPLGALHVALYAMEGGEEPETGWSHKGQFWIATARLLGRPTIIALSILSLCLVVFLSVICVLTRSTSEALRKR